MVDRRWCSRSTTIYHPPSTIYDPSPVTSRNLIRLDTEHYANILRRSVGTFVTENEQVAAMSKLGTLIRGLRIGKRLDLQQMSCTLGTTPRHLDLVETGAVFP